MTKRLPNYTIEYDSDGYYIAFGEWDMCRTYRFSSFKQAEERLAQWIEEDAQAREMSEINHETT